MVMNTLKLFASEVIPVAYSNVRQVLVAPKDSLLH